MIVAVLLKKYLVEETKTIFIASEGRLVVLDMTFSSVNSFGMVAGYASFGSRRSNFFRDQEYFLATLHSIILLQDFNTICNVRVDCVGTTLDRRKKLTYRLEFPDVPV